MSILEILTPLCTSLHITGLFCRGVTLNGHGVIGHVSLVLLAFTSISFIPTPGNGARHRCYVCLPVDKTSSTARDIQVLFPGQVIPDCSNFPNNVTDDGSETAQEFQFDCPNGYTGCALRSSGNGSHKSRTCTPRNFQKCYSLNGVDLCYCTQSLCNRDIGTTQIQPSELPPGREPIRTSRYFAEGVTDDEDLFPTLGGPRPSHHQSATQAQRYDHSEEDEGSGQLDDDEYDEEEDDLNNSEAPVLGQNTSRGGHEPMNRHLEADNLPTVISNDTDPGHHHNESHFPTSHGNHTIYTPHENDPTRPQENGDEELSNENVNNSSEERDAPTVLQSKAEDVQRISYSVLLLISSLVYLVNITKS